MPYKLLKTVEFTHDVPVAVPADGGHQEATLRTRFRHLSDEEAAQFDFGSGEGMKDFLRAVIVRFEDVVDENDRPVAMSDELLERMIGTSYVRLALLRHYGAAQTKARLGN